MTTADSTNASPAAGGTETPPRRGFGVDVGGSGIKGLVMQWQKGKEVTVWPSNLANGQMVFPSFVKLPH